MNSFPQEVVTDLNYTDYLEAHGNSETQIHIGAQEYMRALKVNSYGPETQYFDENGIQMSRTDFEMRYSNWAHGYLKTTNKAGNGFIIKACTGIESIGIGRAIKKLIGGIIQPGK